MSNYVDVSGTVEALWKVNMPKGLIPVDQMLGHAVNSCMTVIARWGAIKFILILVTGNRIL